jgi:hypothetical protein
MRAQGAGWRVGVGQIHQCQIKALIVCLHQGQTVAYADLNTGIIERTAMHGLQMLARELHHGLVQLGQHHALDARMLEQLLGSTTIAPTQNQGLARRGWAMAAGCTRAS